MLNVVVLIMIIVAAAYTIVEIVLHLLRVSPLLTGPGAFLTWLTTLSDAQPKPVFTIGAAVVAAIGVVLIWLAVSPGRLAKHQLGVSSCAVVADNGVIASAVAEHVRREFELPKDSVFVGVSHRAAEVTIRPEPGQIVEKSLVRSSVASELDSYAVTPKLRTRVRVHARGEQEVRHE
ncbi:DUF6286 domain-containing protein [Leucobacter sp. HY1908]